MNSKFSLISKTIGTKFTEYKGNAVRLSQFSPYSVDEVILKSNANPKEIRKVTTFRDSKGDIVERSFDYTGRQLKNRLYSTVDNVIGNDEFVTSKTTKDYSIDRGILSTYKELIQRPKINRFIFWSPDKTTTHHISENIETGEKILSQVQISSKRKSLKQHHSFIEFPRIKNGEKINTKKKELSFDVQHNSNEVIENSIIANGVKIPKNDSFLGYRALTIDDAKVPFAKRFLKEREMDEKEIKILPNYLPIREDENFWARFNAEDGSIEYNKLAKFPSKTKLVGTSAHEVEHSWQYFLQGLYNKEGTPWQTEMVQKFGEIKPENIKEAEGYNEAINNYVPYYVNAEEYRNNLIERLAMHKGADTKNIYDTEGLTIRSQFKHIPKELL